MRFFTHRSAIIATAGLRRSITMDAHNVPLAPRKEDENVWKYPRPPALQRTPNRLRIVWVDIDGVETTLADTDQAFRVCETSHPPTYYLPPDSIKIPLTRNHKQTYCEWKGAARYHDITLPSGRKVENRVWSYPTPTRRFEAIKDYVSFYASAGQSRQAMGGEWHCFVDDERVGVQEGDFYGGWVTSNIKGKMKGGPGTWGW